ncbi:uncharacterized protein [Littorina saxatilis]|uniref:Uncharacterized protein n=1 Tax=Littorina saxatilis TaxID=31220 RepID=A0AAN9B2D2_9CAEN
MKLSSKMAASICIYAVLTVITFGLTSAACDSGNVGVVECADLPTYDDPQWISCLTSEYFEFKSKGKQQCPQGGKYCYYPCVLELYNKDDGKVHSPCNCSLAGTAPTNTLLSDKCSSPDGSDCRWFSDCLNTKFQCADSSKDDDQYGIRYGEKFCRMHEQKNTALSSSAQEWVNAVRRCLQVDLVSLIRPFQTTTCQNIRTQAITSYSECYVKAFKNIDSICALSPQDFWAIFWTIRAAFQADFVEEVYGLVVVLGQCSKPTALALDSYMSKIIISVWVPHCALYDHCIIKRSVHDTAIVHEAYTNNVKDNVLNTLTSKRVLHRTLRVKRAVQWQGESEEEFYYHRGAVDMTQHLAATAEWDSKGITWFTYSTYNPSDNRLQVHILLADKTLGKKGSLNLTRAALDAGEIFHESLPDFKVDGIDVPAGYLLGCWDLRCKKVYMNVTGYDGNAAVTWKIDHMMMMAVATAVVISSNYL